jgi:hypothetical protein
MADKRLAQLHHLLSDLSITANNDLRELAESGPGGQNTVLNLLRKVLEVGAEIGVPREELVRLARESYDRYVVEGRFTGVRQY